MYYYKMWGRKKKPLTGFMERHLEAETIDPHIIQQISMQISSLAKLGRECEETANPANSLLCQVANIIPPNSHYRFC